MPEDRPKTENPNIVRARELVIAHGWNSTSFQIINPGIHRWFSSKGDAVVGYMSSCGVRVVVGAPVCEKSRLTAIADEFEADAADAGEHVCYFGAEKRLEAIFSDSPRHTKFLLGAQPVWRPVEWGPMVSRSKSIRAQLNRAVNKEVVVSEWSNEKAREHPRLEACLARF